MDHSQREMNGKNKFLRKSLCQNDFLHLQFFLEEYCSHNLYTMPDYICLVFVCLFVCLFVLFSIIAHENIDHILPQLKLMMP